MTPPPESPRRPEGALLGECRLFLTALQFFTRIPVPAWVGWSPAQLNASARHFPSVGWVVGACYAVVLWWGAHAWGPLIAAWLAIAVGVWLTGAFHEDGFADSCDGLGGGHTLEKILSIMKDSRVGSYAVVGVVVVLALRAELLSLLLRQHVTQPLVFTACVIASHSLSRWSALWVMARLRYVREDASSKSKPIAQGVGPGPMLMATVIAVAPALCLGAGALVSVAAASGMAALAVVYLRRRMGGYTGDVLGATQVVSELAILLALTAMPGSGWHGV
jgi:adenosylcobinamide-GDP ribazoletransferase